MARQAATRQSTTKSQVRVKASKQAEPKAATGAPKPARAEAAEGSAEPSKEQLEKARVESEKALKEFERQGAGDSTLTRYFREMIGHRVLTPQEEIEAAKQVERLEIAYWEALLSYPACFESVAAVIEGVAGGLMFSVLGLHGAVLWGVVMAILAFIPVVGISLVFVPFSLILLLAGESARALSLFLPLVAVATVVEYWLKPLLVGRRAQMHTLLVFLSLIGGVMVFGAVGLLLGPLMMTAFLTLAGIYRERYSRFIGAAPGSVGELEVPDDDGSKRDDAVPERTG